MPTYEYTCKTCGENFEVFQSFSDKPLKKHKGCGGQLQKVFHVRGIVFKGSGFYATDSKGSSSARGEDRAASGSKKDSDSTKDAGSKKDSGSQKDSDSTKDAGSKKDSGSQKGSKPEKKATASTAD